MGVIVLEGLAITVLVLAGLREAVMDAVPMALKRAIAVGIGLFILFIGFVDGGLIVGRQGPVPVAFVFPNSPRPGSPCPGWRLPSSSDARKVPAALIISIVLTSVVAYLLGVQHAAGHLLGDAGLLHPRSDFRTSPGSSPSGCCRGAGDLHDHAGDFFDTMGTVTGIAASRTDDEDGTIPVRRVLLVDCLAAAVGGPPASARTRPTSRAPPASARAAGPA